MLRQVFNVCARTYLHHIHFMLFFVTTNLLLSVIYTSRRRRFHSTSMTLLYFFYSATLLAVFLGRAASILVRVCKRQVLFVVRMLIVTCRFLFDKEKFSLFMVVPLLNSQQYFTWRKRSIFVGFCFFRPYLQQLIHRV